MAILLAGAGDLAVVDATAAVSNSCDACASSIAIGCPRGFGSSGVQMLQRRPANGWFMCKVPWQCLAFYCLCR